MLAAVGQQLGGLFHRDLRPVDELGLGVLRGGDHIPYRLDALLHLLAAVRRCGGDGLHVRQHAVHHLAGSFGHSLLLLLGAVSHLLGDSLRNRRGCTVYLCSCLGNRGDDGLGCLFDLDVSKRQALCQTGAGLHADLREDLGGRVDAQNALDGVYHARDLALDRGHQAVPHPGDAVQQTLNDVFADVAPLVHGAVPDAQQLADASKGCLAQILDAAEDAVHQSGQQGRAAFENVGQMGDQGGGEVGNQHSRRRDKLGQVLGEADHQCLAALHTGVDDLVGVLADVIHQ